LERSSIPDCRNEIQHFAKWSGDASGNSLSKF
jgi:hypothetical protein